MNHSIRRRAEQGTSLMEILITLIILLVGLLGLAGVMLQSQRAQLESYERVQALMIAQDMADRLASNRSAATCYAFTTDADGEGPYLGTGGAAVPVCGTGSATQVARAQADLAQWRDLMLGSAEVSSGASVGAVLGARGCVNLVTGTANTYQISVVWQGRDPTGAPPANIPCGKDLYGNEIYRRAVSLRVQLANLS